MASCGGIIIFWFVYVVMRSASDPPPYIGHDDIRDDLPIGPRLLTVTMHGQDVWMGEGGGSLSLTFEAAGIFMIILVVCWKRFDGNLATEKWIFSQPDLTHTSPANTPQE